MSISRQLAALLVLGATVGYLPCRAAEPPIAEETVSFRTHDGLTLEGFISYPSRDTGPLPAMLLLAGRGPHDADLTLEHPILTRGVQKLFQRTARFFNRRGYIVLRFNKRGASFDHLADQPDLLWSSTFSDLVEDAHGALATLIAHPRAAAAPVVVYGLSEGTMVAAHLARDAEVDLLVLAGSLNDVSSVIRYQYVDRYVTFYREAADANRDGLLTLAELDRLDGRSGLSHYLVYAAREALFELADGAGGGLEVRGFNPLLDENADGRLDIDGEILAAFERNVEGLLEQTQSGERNSFDRSFVRLEPMTRLLPSIDASVLLVHGDLDLWNHPEEARAIAAGLEELGRDDYRQLTFPRLGHSLSRPVNSFGEDGGLTIHDNPTLNSPRKVTLRRIAREVKTLLR